MTIVSTNQLVVRRSSIPILAATDLEIAAGERIGICGGNGTGKTTLLRVLAGLEPAPPDMVTFDCAAADITLVHQHPWLFHGGVLGNIEYGLAARRINRSARRQVAGEWLERLGISQLAGRQVEGLSGGERRRVALARALAIEPKLLLLDEPLAEIDDAGIAMIREVLEQLEHTTVVITSPVDLPDGFVERTIWLATPQTIPTVN